MMQKIITFLFLLNLILSLEGSAQTIRPAVQQGHFNDVESIGLSDNEEILTSIGKDGQTIQWDLKTGMQLNRQVIGSSDQPLVKPKTFGWTTPVEDTIRMNTGDTIIKVIGPTISFHVKGIEIAKRTTQYFDMGFSDFVTTKNIRYIFASSYDGLIYVYDKKDFKQIELLKMHNSSVNDLVITKNGQSVFSASTDRSIIEWNTNDLSMIRRFHGYSFRITALSFDLNGEFIYLGNEIGELKKFDLQSYSQSISNYKLSQHAITNIIPSLNDKDSLLRIVSLDNKILSFNPEKSKTKTYKKYHRISWKQSQQNVMGNGLGMYLDPPFENVYLDYNDNQTSLFYAANEVKGRLRRKMIFKNTLTGKRKTIRSDWNKVKELTVINDTLVAVLKNNDQSMTAVSAQEDAELTIWKIKKKKLYSFDSGITQINSINCYKNQYLFILKSDSLLIWDMKSNKIFRSRQKEINYGSSIFIKNNFCFVSDASNQVAVFEIISGTNLKFKGKLKGHDGKITCLDVSTNKNLIATGSFDATVRFWSLDSLNELGTLIPVSRTDFILLAPTGEYQITKKAFQRFGFFSGTDFIYPAQFDLRFNMPHVVLENIGIGDKKDIQMLENAYLKRIKRMGFEQNTEWQNENSLPEIEILSQKKENSKLTLSVNAFDETYPLDRINVFVNDVPVHGSKGLSVAELKVKEWKEDIIVELINGKNKIEISLLNSNGVESLRKTVLVEEVETLKSDLYVLAFGASRYQDKNRNLTYPDKDATDLNALLTKNEKGIFQQVHTRSVTNEEFNKASLQDCKEFLKSARTQDVVIIFVAGHGVLDKNLDYYLATYDMDFSNPSDNGLPYEELESMLDGIAPLKKVLFIDACHSGEVDKEEVELLATNTTTNTKVKFRDAGTGIQKKNIGLKSASELMGELFTDLRRGTGATVISSAGGVESAMESDEWKNGLFTYCLLHGLKDKAADTNRDGQIMLSELQIYLRKEVTELSNGAQQPTSRIENLSMDFRIW